MNYRRSGRRGQPVVTLALILAAWIGARVLTWTPLAAVLPPALVDSVRKVVPAAPPRAPLPVASRDPPEPARTSPAGLAWPAPPTMAFPAPRAMSGDPVEVAPVAETPSLDQAAGGHQLLWMAAVAQLPLPLTLAPQRATAPNRAAAPRWSSDGWLFLRGGDRAALAGGLAAPAYGASQVGAVLRFSLAPGRAQQPALYVRLASALALPRQQEAALGLSARPIAALPVAALVEARLTRDSAGERVRPAAMLVTQLAPFRLPGGLEGEVYAQGGYIAGAAATAFGDAQARITRAVVHRARLRLALGGGAWAGGQRGAARVDIGPTASLALPLGAGSARLAADWRLRVAGDARPASGPAVTISAGF